MLVATRLLASVLTGLVAAFVLAVTAAAVEGPVNTVPPRITGEAVYDGVLRVGPGQWDPADVQLTYRWLRDGMVVRGADRRSYRPDVQDLGRRMSVRVTAIDAEGGTGQVVAAPTGTVERATLTNKVRPTVVGTKRFTHTVTATPGRWSTTPQRVRYQWHRSGRPIPGATNARYTYVPQDVGRHIRVQVTATAPGHRRSRAFSARGEDVGHRVDVRRKVTYSVVTRGRITAGLKQFRQLAQQTFADARGWRAKGVQFRPVRQGGSFTLVLAEASTVPSFSSGCSSMWSCRVGRYVIINQTRW